MEEDSEWMFALKAALVPLPPRPLGPGETGSQLKGRQGAPKPILGPPPTKGGQKKPGPATGKGTVAPTGGGAAAGKKSRRPSSPWDQEEDKVQVVKVQPGGVTMPMRVKERPVRARRPAAGGGPTSGRGRATGGEEAECGSIRGAENH